MSSVLKETRKGNISFLKSGQRHRKVCSVVAEASNSETNSFFYQPRNSFDSNERTVFWQKTVTWTKLLPLTFFLQSAASSELWIIGTWRFVSSRFSIVRSFDVFGDNFKNRNSCHRSIFFLLGLIFLRREWLSLRREWLWSYNLNSFFCPVQFDGSFFVCFWNW